MPVLTDDLSDIALIRKTVVDLDSKVHALADSVATFNANAVLPFSTRNNGNTRSDAGHDVALSEMAANITEGCVGESANVTQRPQQA